ncbi:MAG: membrane protein insertion efficiency factor YidD [Pseudomonadota bacterium]
MAALTGWRSGLAAALLKAPVHLYRWTIKPWIGLECRHLPTCSEYALEAIDTNGAWRGFWLMLSRIARCNPWGSAGYDPVPDIRAERHPLAPWRYGRWTGRHIARRWEKSEPGV